jgi:hypothetical protein
MNFPRGKRHLGICYLCYFCDCLLSYIYLALKILTKPHTILLDTILLDPSRFRLGASLLAQGPTVRARIDGRQTLPVV